MFMRLLVWCVILTACDLAAGQDWAKTRLEQSPRHGEWVQLEHDARKVDAFVVYPEVSGKATAVVVIHEIFGLTDWVRGVADQLAESGYIAIAPDLLSGTGKDGGGSQSFSGFDEARKAIAALPPDQIMADLDAAVAYVLGLPACNGKVAVSGFCWGGGQTFRFAARNSKILAAFPFYGSAPEDALDIARIRCPVYAFYAGNDARINATLDKTKEMMTKADKKFEPVTYEGAGHGFMRMGESPNPGPADQKSRDLAWLRWKELLGKL
jgi:carboxymethylenebutenolidase